MKFEVTPEYSLRGDQPQVVEGIAQGLQEHYPYQTIKGATGTGKTFVMAKVIEKINRPALIISHNKTLAAQLFNEFKQFLPNNAVEYFVSYYDYYQPEAYVAKRDLYIEKESSINEEIDRMRLKATSALMERSDVVIVASVSCIYGLGSPEDYKNMYVRLNLGKELNRRDLIKALLDIQYERKDEVLERGFFRVRGDVIDIHPAYLQTAYRVEFFGDEVEGLAEIDPLNNEVIHRKKDITIFPAKHFVMPQSRIEEATKKIRLELDERVKYFENANKVLEKERIYNRTLYDLELLKTVGFCPGIENYSFHLSGRKLGERPSTLFDYFPKDFVVFVDESHVTLPQVRGMFNGDRARKQSLVDYGFRLPSALENRPLVYEEFFSSSKQFVFVSATPNEEELKISKQSEELINRPTGLLDPEIEVRSSTGQVDDLIFEIKKEIEKDNCVLVTTLTKRMAEDLSDYLKDNQIKVTYLHSDIDTIERVDIIKQLRAKKIRVIVGINLLREGLDLPEVSLVAILDADKIGFLRSKTSLIQTVGRAARNADGRVIMYGEKTSSAMEECIKETNRRREIQIAFNEKHGITPKSIVKPVNDILEREGKVVDEAESEKYLKEMNLTKITAKSKAKDIKSTLEKLDLEMRIAADRMDFEKAIFLRDKIEELKIKHNLRKI